MGRIASTPFGGSTSSCRIASNRNHGVRYIHTSSELVEKPDLKAAHDILIAYLASK